MISVTRVGQQSYRFSRMIQAWLSIFGCFAMALGFAGCGSGSKAGSGPAVVADFALSASPGSVTLAAGGATQQISLAVIGIVRAEVVHGAAAEL